MGHPQTRKVVWWRAIFFAAAAIGASSQVGQALSNQICGERPPPTADAPDRERRGDGNPCRPKNKPNFLATLEATRESASCFVASPTTGGRLRGHVVSVQRCVANRPATNRVLYVALPARHFTRRSSSHSGERTRRRERRRCPARVMSRLPKAGRRGKAPRERRPS